ncbi:MAG TPA: AraC family transcriptional regulator [Bacteroidales bacterium]|nr:AraC family transcriptional regulator [Bacteroidales bacterium]HPS62121.1 AraC family transcriptional regulator [Bacteroidales bacterium]
MTFIFFTILTAVTIFITALLSLFFFINKRGFIPENRLLAMLLLIFCLQVFYSYATSFFAWEHFLPWHKPLFMIRQTSLLIGPLIWLYINAFLKRRTFVAANSSLHALPFAATWMFLLFFFRGTDRFVIWESYTDLVTTILILVHTMIYLVWSLVSLHPEKTGASEVIRNIRSASHHRWIHTLLLGFMLMWIINLNSFALYMIVRRPGWCAYTESIYALTVFLFINAIMLVLLLRPEGYYIVTKYKNTRLSEPEKSEYLGKLNAYMEEHKPYLDPDITLEFLANEISVSPRLLSQVINETYKKNFKGFILEYRIRESMKILADEKHAKLTVLEVLYQVGFNSKSAFNNQFKLYTNLTPLEYRAQAVRG